MKRKIILFLITGILFCCGCGEQQKSENVQNEIKSSTREIFAMDTYMTVTAYGENADKAVKQAEERLNELDAGLSVGIQDSIISELNSKGRAELTKDAAYLMKRSLELWDKTDGAFDPAIYPVMEEWGFTTKEYKVPDYDKLQRKVMLSDASKIKFDEVSGNVEFETEGMKVDFGGIAKGYASSEIMDIFKENEIISGIVSLGGNVQVYGSKTDGSLWRVAIQNPDGDDSYIGILRVKDKAVITSGGYERYFIEDGKTYHHIINPATGYPAESGLKSVTIVSEDGTLADGLSTSLFVMGLDKAKEFWNDNADKFDAILFTDDNALYVTEGIADSFESDTDITIIEKED